MSLPQFPNVFYGSVTYKGRLAPIGMIITAVVEDDGGTIRHYSMGVEPRGKFGAPNGLKLKVGGDGTHIHQLTRIRFYCTFGRVDFNESIYEAGHAHFFSDSQPHITGLVLCQD